MPTKSYLKSCFIASIITISVSGIAAKYSHPVKFIELIYVQLLGLIGFQIIYAIEGLKEIKI